MKGLTDVNKEEMKKIFEDSKNKAKEIIKDKEKTKIIIEEAIKRVNNIEDKNMFEAIWEDLMSMFNMEKDWINENYKSLSTGSVIAILSGMIYLLSPIDIIPDAIPMIGYLDDIFVLIIIIEQVKKELEKYKNWSALNR